MSFIFTQELTSCIDFVNQSVSCHHLLWRPRSLSTDLKQVETYWVQVFAPFFKLFSFIVLTKMISVLEVAIGAEKQWLVEIIAIIVNLCITTSIVASLAKESMNYIELLVWLVDCRLLLLASVLKLAVHPAIMMVAWGSTKDTPQQCKIFKLSALLPFCVKRYPMFQEFPWSIQNAKGQNVET